MPQLVRIPHHVQRPNDLTLNLKRRSLHHSLGCFHDDAREAVDGPKTHREILTPPLTWVWARGVHDEPCRAIGALDHVQRRSHLAAAICYDTYVGCEQLCQSIQIARLSR